MDLHIPFLIWSGRLFVAHNPLAKVNKERDYPLAFFPDVRQDMRMERGVSILRNRR